MNLMKQILAAVKMPVIPLEIRNGGRHGGHIFDPNDFPHRVHMFDHIADRHSRDGAFRQMVDWLKLPERQHWECDYDRVAGAYILYFVSETDAVEFKMWFC